MERKKQNQDPDRHDPQIVADIVATGVANTSDLKRYAWGVYQELQTAFEGLFITPKKNKNLNPLAGE